MKLYLMYYIKDVIIPETNKCLNSAMKLSEYICVIGFSLIIACYIGHYIKDFFFNYPITPQKGTPIHFNHIIYGIRLEKITHIMYYKNLDINEFNDTF